MAEKSDKSTLFDISSELNKLIGILNVLPALAQTKQDDKVLEFMDSKAESIGKIENSIKDNPDALSFESDLKDNLLKQMEQAKHMPRYENKKWIFEMPFSSLSKNLTNCMNKINNKAFEGIEFK